MRRVLENQSHFLIPSQIYSAAAKYIWLYIPGCDGVLKINHISLCPAKTNWRTSGAPDQNKTLKDEEPSLKKTVVLLNYGSWERLHQLLPQPDPAATYVMKKNVLIFAQLCVFLAQMDDKDLGHMWGREVETPSQVDMQTSPPKSHSCSPWP